MGQVTFLLGVLGEVFPNGGPAPFFGEYFARSLTQLAPSAAFLQPLFLCGLSRDTLSGSSIFDFQRSLQLWNGPRLGTKRLTSTAKSAPTPTPSSNRPVRQTSTLTGVLECA